jgi:hypothetical protein
MKKVIVIFCVQIFLISGFVSAEDVGITVGMEVGLGNVNKANDGDLWPYMKPTISYSHSFLEGKMGIYAEMDYTFGFIKERDYEWKEVFPQTLVFVMNVSYNLRISSTSLLTFYLENNNDNILIAPDAGYERFQDRVDGVIKTSALFSQKFEFGGLLAKLGSPIYYLKRGFKGDLPAVGLNVALGWKTNFGLAVGGEYLVALTPSVLHGYREITFLASYDSKKIPIYAQVEVKVPNDNEIRGLTITPKLYYFFRPFNLIASCALDSVGGRKWNNEYKEIGISPALMFNYYF